MPCSLHAIFTGEKVKIIGRPEKNGFIMAKKRLNLTDQSMD